VDEAVEALRTDEPKRIPVTLTREQRREQQLHRMAFRHGLRLRKSVRGDERARHFGTYALYDKRDVMVVGSPESGYGLSLDDVEAVAPFRATRIDRTWSGFAGSTKFSPH
jgi:hypothetical protein